MPVKTDDPVVETLLEPVGAPVHAGLDPVALVVKVAGDALSPVAQVIGQAFLAAGFGPVGTPLELPFDPVGLAVETGIDPVAPPLEFHGGTLSLVLAVGVLVRGKGGGRDGKGQGRDCQNSFHWGSSSSGWLIRSDLLLPP